MVLLQAVIISCRPNSPTGTRSTSRNAILHASATAVTGISNGHANGTAADASAQHADGHPAQQNATTATQTGETIAVCCCKLQNQPAYWNCYLLACMRLTGLLLASLSIACLLNNRLLTGLNSAQLQPAIVSYKGLAFSLLLSVTKALPSDNVLHQQQASAGTHAAPFLLSPLYQVESTILLGLLSPHMVSKMPTLPADDAMGNGQRSIPHVAAAEGPTASSRPRSSGGGITPAAATAVAHIRRRRAAARSQQTHPHSSSAAAAAPAADTATVSAPAAAPNAAILNRPSLPHMANVASEQAIDSHCNAASTSPIDPSAAAPQQLQQAAAIQKGRDPMPSEVPDQAAANCTREGPPLDRALSVSRPPLPFHAIRRSARLHKTADRAPAGVSQPAARGQAELQMGGGQDADADMSFSGAKSHPEISGPCTR